MTGERSEYELRDQILKELSDEEISEVSTAQSQARLADGDEYVDLEHLDQGVRQAHGSPVAMGRVIPRSAVRDATWSKILSQIDGAAHQG